MSVFNNYGSYIGKQNGDAGSFNNVGCVIGEQVIDGRKQPKEKDQADFDKRMREHERQMKELEARMRAMKKKFCG